MKPSLLSLDERSKPYYRDKISHHSSSAFVDLLNEYGPDFSTSIDSLLSPSSDNVDATFRDVIHPLNSKKSQPNTPLRYPKKYRVKKTRQQHVMSSSNFVQMVKQAMRGPEEFMQLLLSFAYFPSLCYSGFVSLMKESHDEPAVYLEKLFREEYEKLTFSLDDHIKISGWEILSLFINAPKYAELLEKSVVALTLSPQMMNFVHDPSFESLEYLFHRFVAELVTDYRKLVKLNHDSSLEASKSKLLSSQHAARNIPTSDTPYLKVFNGVAKDRDAAVETAYYHSPMRHSNRKLRKAHRKHKKSRRERKKNYNPSMYFPTSHEPLSDVEHHFVPQKATHHKKLEPHPVITNPVVIPAGREDHSDPKPSLDSPTFNLGETISRWWNNFISFVKMHDDVIIPIFGSIICLLVLVFAIIPIFIYLKRRYNGYQPVQTDIQPCRISSGPHSMQRQTARGSKSKSGKKYPACAYYEATGAEWSSSNISGDKDSTNSISKASQLDLINMGDKNQTFDV